MGETTGTTDTDTYSSPDERWNFEVGYNPDLVYRYVPINVKHKKPLSRYSVKKREVKALEALPTSNH